MSKYNYIVSTNKDTTKFIVYLATSPSGKQYVGITTRKLIRRIMEHTVGGNIGSIFTKAIKKNMVLKI